MKVETLTERTLEPYEQYLLTKKASLFYHSLKYRNFLKTLLKCEAQYLLAIDTTGICGVLPMMFTEGQGGRIYNSLPYFGSNGDILSDNEAAYEALIHAYNEIAEDSRSLSATVVTNPFSDREKGPFVHNYVDWRIAQFTALGTSNRSHDLLTLIDSSARRNIRRALAEGVAVEIDNSQMNALRVMHQENMRMIGGMSKTDTFFSLIPQYFSAGEDYDIYVAKQDQTVIAALLIFYFNRTVEYFTPAIRHDCRSIQPMAPILISAMQEAARRGFAIWNWGGTWTSQEGVYRFKKKWGAVDRRYCYYTQLNGSDVLNWPSTRIREAFPHFFVVPFSALNDQSHRLEEQENLCLESQRNHP